MTLKGNVAVISMRTEQPHGRIIQMGSKIMGKGARDSYENDNNRGSLHLNRTMPRAILSHTSFHLEQCS